MSIAEAEAKHHEAMVCLDKALLAQRRGDATARREHLARACELESEAASAVVNERELEPTRGILHRSAANLAIQCGQLKQAEKLIAAGLTGDPPEAIAEELRQLFEQVKRMYNGNGGDTEHEPQSQRASPGGATKE